MNSTSPCQIIFILAGKSSGLRTGNSAKLNCTKVIAAAYTCLQLCNRRTFPQEENFHVCRTKRMVSASVAALKCEYRPEVKSGRPRIGQPGRVGTQYGSEILRCGGMHTFPCIAYSLHQLRRNSRRLSKEETSQECDATERAVFLRSRQQHQVASLRLLYPSSHRGSKLLLSGGPRRDLTTHGHDNTQEVHDNTHIRHIAHSDQHQR